MTQKRFQERTDCRNKRVRRLLNAKENFELLCWYTFPYHRFLYWGQYTVSEHPYLMVKYGFENKSVFLWVSVICNVSHAQRYPNAHTYTYTDRNIHVYTYMCKYMYLHMYVMHVKIHAHTCVHKWTCANTDMSVDTHMLHTRMHTYTDMYVLTNCRSHFIDQATPIAC